MKMIWKGAISFGLVNIPIKLYSAIKNDSVDFKLLHKKDNGPIIYKRVCTVCHQDVAWQDIVKGMKLSDGSYFIMTPANIEKLKPQKSDAISIQEFVDTSAIEPIYYDNHYYVMPDKYDDRGFFLFMQIMQKLQLSAIGTFVMKDKEYVCALKSYQSGLLLSTLHYADQLRPMLEKEKGAVKVSQSERVLAQELIEKLYVKNFDMKLFKDTFTQKLLKRIRAQAKGAPIKAEPRRIPLKKPEHNLIDALKESLSKELAAYKKASKTESRTRARS